MTKNSSAQCVLTVLAFKNDFWESWIFGFKNIHPKQVFMAVQPEKSIQRKNCFRFHQVTRLLWCCESVIVDKTVDAVSAATPRKKFEEVVNYKK